MTISDLIARLTELQKQVGSTAQVKLGNAYNCTERPFDYFTIHKSPDNKHVFLVPSDVWDRNSLKSFARREAMK